jgi:broad specificity phosphatase PhoE
MKAGQILYVARHGETVWNRDGRFQGRLDSPLTRRGLDQARRMSETLAQLIPRSERQGWTIVASPLGRAQHTARIIAGILGLAGAGMETEARLAEVDIGSWAGLDMAEIEACSPRALDGTTRHDWHFRAPDGESHAAMSRQLSRHGLSSRAADPRWPRRHFAGAARPLSRPLRRGSAAARIAAGCNLPAERRHGRRDPLHRRVTAALAGLSIHRLAASMADE